MIFPGNEDWPGTSGPCFVSWMQKPTVLLVHDTSDLVAPISALQTSQSERTRLGFDITTHVAYGGARTVDFSPFASAAISWQRPRWAAFRRPAIQPDKLSSAAFN